MGLPPSQRPLGKAPWKVDYGGIQPPHHSSDLLSHPYPTHLPFGTGLEESPLRRQLRVLLNMTNWGRETIMLLYI